MPRSLRQPHLALLVAAADNRGPVAVRLAPGVWKRCNIQARRLMCVLANLRQSVFLGFEVIQLAGAFRSHPANSSAGSYNCRDSGPPTPSC